MANEIPVATESTMAEVDAVTTRINQRISNVFNIYGTVFLNINVKFPKVL